VVLGDPPLFKDVIDRAELVAGAKFARELKLALDGERRNRDLNRSFARTPGMAPPPMPVAPEFGSPYQIFVDGEDRERMASLAELAFRTCYFAIAVAYDFRGVETKRKIPLWQTRMTVDAQGVSMREIMTPLIATAGSFLGRDQPEAIMVKKHLNRDGRVEIGTPTVVEESKRTAPSVPEPAPARGR